MTFHLIFTRGTLPYLWIFTKSLLDFSSLNFRIIANDLSDAEIKFLKIQEKENSRLELIILPYERMQEHHVILNELYSMNQTEKLFCFMDTDILANGYFMSDFESLIKDCDAVYSCKPVWETDPVPESGFFWLQGRHLYSSSGILVGSSYFSIYRREAVDFVISEYGVDFSRYQKKRLDPAVNKILSLYDIDYNQYDTAKILNILLYHSGRKMSYAESDYLFHIGGMSWNKSIVDYSENVDENFEHVENSVLRSKIILRRKVGKYFSQLLDSLRSESKLPAFPNVGSEEIDREIRRISQVLVEQYKPYRMNTEVVDQLNQII